MTYIDGFVAAVPNTNREQYKAARREQVFKEYGGMKRGRQGRAKCHRGRRGRIYSCAVVWNGFQRCGKQRSDRASGTPAIVTRITIRENGPRIPAAASLNCTHEN
jgi:hypothetical protein